MSDERPEGVPAEAVQQSINLEITVYGRSVCLHFNGVDYWLDPEQAKEFGEGLIEGAQVALASAE